MSLERVKQEVAALTPADDRNPANWLTLEQPDEKLKTLDEAGGQ